MARKACHRKDIWSRKAHHRKIICLRKADYRGNIWLRECTIEKTYDQEKRMIKNSLGGFAMVPKDPVMLLSYINTQLRDNYPSIQELCSSLDLEQEEIMSKLRAIQYGYDQERNQFVPMVSCWPCYCCHIRYWRGQYMGIDGVRKMIVKCSHQSSCF